MPSESFHYRLAPAGLRQLSGLPAKAALLGALGALFALLSGCTGSADSRAPSKPAASTSSGGSSGLGPASTTGTGSTPNLGTGGSAGVPVPTACNSPYPGAAPIRRLTRAEYNNTVADLLKDTSNPADQMPSDSVRFAYETSIAPHGVTAPLVEQYMQVAEVVSGHVLANLAAALPCQPANGEEACARTYISTLCTGAYRRACTNEDTDPLFAMWQTGRAAGDFKTGIQYVLELVLQTADFLYRPEFGDPATAGAGYVRLTGAELASRLAYSLWGTMPDASLMAAAERGDLATDAGVATEAKRLLQDPRAHEVVQRFHEQWLVLDGLESASKSDAFAGFNDARSLMKDETRAFVTALFTENASLGTLFTAPYSFSNDALAAFYGLPSAGSGTMFSKVSRVPARTAGILTQGSFLAVNAKSNQSAPVMRGVDVLKQVLCADLPAPPPDLKIMIPEPTADTTTRARFEQHEKDMACSGCHSIIDQVGFGFEHFDAVGRWRDMDNGHPVDATGSLKGTDVDGSFNGAAELAQKLATSEQVRACYVKQIFYNVHGRPPGAEDKCSLDKLGAEFKASEFSLQDLAVSVTQTDAFLYRIPVTP